MEIDDLKINDPLADAPKFPVFYIIISPIVSSDVPFRHSLLTLCPC